MSDFTREMNQLTVRVDGHANQKTYLVVHGIQPVCGDDVTRVDQTV
jgi:hypothetical protein